MGTISITQVETLSETKRRLLEGYRRGGLAHPPEGLSRISPRPRGAIAPLSSAQEQIWRREQTLTDGSLPHNECITLRANRKLDTALLERCFAEIVRRHEIWRTSYGIADGQPIQLVHEASEGHPLQAVDLRAASETEQEAELLKLYTQGVRQPFDLANGPLFRVTLVSLTNTDQRILVFAHLSIVDGVSVYQILPAELTSLLAAFSAGQSSPLPDPLIQYGDYACWQREWLRSQEAAEQLTYWQQQLTGELPVLQWPGDRPRSAVKTHRGAVRSFALRPALGGALREFSQRDGLTLFTTLAASLSVLLHCYTRQSNIILGTPSLGARKRSEVKGLLGHFLNPVPLRVNLEGDSSFRELSLRIQQVIGGAVCHDDVPLSNLAQEVQPNQLTPSGDVFNVALSLQPETPEEGWLVTSMDADSGGTIWDLYLAFIETKGGVIGRAQYNTDLLSESVVEHALEGLQVVMESVTRDPKQLISTLPFQLRSAGLL